MVGLEEKELQIRSIKTRKWLNVVDGVVRQVEDGQVGEMTWLNYG